MIRVLLADDQNLIREGLKALLEQEPDLEVIADVDNGCDAVSQTEALRPDVVLMDLTMPKMDGIAATQNICERFPEIRVLVLTASDDGVSIKMALQVGARGYLLKDMSPDELANAVRTAHKGFTQLSPGILQKAMAADVPTPPLETERSTNNVLPFAAPQRRSTSDLPPGFMKLTARERQVLKLIAEGSSNREIAQTLDISEGTVKNHVASILGRLNLRDRTQAAIIANTVMPLL
jgi:DNA-binding NarL/FixJ family response regulator